MLQQKEIDEAKAEWERGLQLARDRNEALRVSIQANAHEWMQGRTQAFNQDIVRDKARRAEGRAAYLDRYLKALRSGQPLPIASPALFDQAELKYMSAHGVPVAQATP